LYNGSSITSFNIGTLNANVFSTASSSTLSGASQAAISYTTGITISGSGTNIADFKTLFPNLTEQNGYRNLI
jgi:hypothetical protein